MNRINVKCTIGNEQLAVNEQKAYPKTLCGLCELRGKAFLEKS
jgi:hypothetical protein